jgi:hypothetical protein
MKVYGGVDVQVHVFLTLALVGSEWSVSCPGRFILGEGPPGTQWVGGWGSLRGGLEDMEKRESLTPPGLELWPVCHPARSQSL